MMLVHPVEKLVHRLASLDAFRGLTIAAMILVNNPGSWEHVYPPLEHAAWHGWTPTDLIFPFFLFIMGVAMAFSLDRAAAGDDRPSLHSKVLGWKALHLKIVRRSAILFALGLFLSAFPDFDLSRLRVAGAALEALAACYWLIDVRGYTRWAQPAIVYGLNSIAVFVLSGIVTRLLYRIHVGGEDGVSLWSWTYQHLFASWATPLNASLAMAIAYVALWWALMALLYRRGLFIKI